MAQRHTSSQPRRPSIDLTGRGSKERQIHRCTAPVCLSVCAVVLWWRRAPPMGGGVMVVVVGLVGFESA